MFKRDKQSSRGIESALPVQSDTEFHDSMRRTWSLQEDRPQVEGALGLDGVHKGMMVQRTFKDRKTGEEFHENYRLVTDPSPVNEEEDGGYFQGGGHVVQGVKDYSGLRASGFPMGLVDEYALHPIHLSSAGAEPYQTVEGPMWTTAVRLTELEGEIF